MQQEEDGFYNDLEEEQEEEDHEGPWEQHRGRTINPGTVQPLNEPPPSQSRFARRTKPPPSVKPEQPEPIKEAKPPVMDFKERSRRYRERQEERRIAEAPEPDRADQSESDIPIAQNPPKGNSFANLASSILRRRLRFIMEEELDSFDSPLIYGQVKQTIRETLADMEVAMDWYKAECSDFLHESGTEFSRRAWIRNDGKIMANLRKSRNSRLLPILEQLAKFQIPFTRSSRLRLGKIEIEGKEKWPVLTRSDGPTISKIAERVHRSESQVWKYIEGAKQAGFLRRLGPKHRGSYLVLGVHRWYKDKSGNERRRPVYFLKNTPEIREALRTFRKPD